jgi:hypothetical protein
MGMFDRVLARCPHCGEIVELQSKAGPCALDDYWIDNVPVDIADNLVHNWSAPNSTCQHCGHLYRFVQDRPVPRTVKCKLIEWDDYEGDDK